MLIHILLLHSILLAKALVCRPGDTVLLMPDTPHFIGNVAVDWPLRLMGGGQAPEDTSLCCPVGAEFAINYRYDAVSVHMTHQISCAPWH